MPTTPRPENYAFTPASALSREIAAGRLSPIDVMDEFLQRIARFDGWLNAFVSVYEEDARLAARAADSAIRAGHGDHEEVWGARDGEEPGAVNCPGAPTIEATEAYR